MRKSRLFVVTGRVQGVGFRAAAREAAARRDLCGWVTNRDDGAVELVAGGSDDALDALYAWLRKGPPGARVDHVSQQQAAPAQDLPTPFSIR